MTALVDGESLDSFLTPLKGHYSRIATAEWELVERLEMDGLQKPPFILLKVVTNKAKWFCNTSLESDLKIEAGRYNFSKGRFRLYDSLANAMGESEPVFLIGISTGLNIASWNELVYVRTGSEKFDLRKSVLKAIAQYSNPKP